jgi:NADPH:quinone reductase-like Zn-dependent oxidoreductase
MTRPGADHVVDFSKEDLVEAIRRLTSGRGVDVAIEALGTQATFDAALRVLRPWGTLSSRGVYSGDLKIPLDAFLAGLGDTPSAPRSAPAARSACGEMSANLFIRCLRRAWPLITPCSASPAAQASRPWRLCQRHRSARR